MSFFLSQIVHMQVNLLLFDIHSISVSHSEIPLKQIDEYAQKHLFTKGKDLNYQYWIQVLASLNINLLGSVRPRLTF